MRLINAYDSIKSRKLACQRPCNYPRGPSLCPAVMRSCPPARVMGAAAACIVKLPAAASSSCAFTPSQSQTASIHREATAAGRPVPAACGASTTRLGAKLPSISIQLALSQPAAHTATSTAHSTAPQQRPWRPRTVTALA